MSKFGFETLAGSLVILTLGVAVGCGDSTVHKESIPKLPASGSRGGSAGAGGSSGAGGAANLKVSKQTATTEAAIKTQLDGDTSYKVITQDDLLPGKYVLKGIETLYKYMPAASSNFVQVLATSDIQFSGNTATAVASGDALTMGVLNNKVDKGLAVQFPVIFVKDGSAPAFSDTQAGKHEVLQIFLSQVAQSGATVKSNDHFESTDAAAIPLNAVINKSAYNEMKASIQQIDGTHIQVVLNADDKSVAGKTSDVSRVFIFVYEFTAPAPPRSNRKGSATHINDDGTSNDADGSDDGSAADGPAANGSPI